MTERYHAHCDRSDRAPSDTLEYLLTAKPSSLRCLRMLSRRRRPPPIPTLWLAEPQYIVPRNMEAYYIGCFLSHPV